MSKLYEYEKILGFFGTSLGNLSIPFKDYINNSYEKISIKRLENQYNSGYWQNSFENIDYVKDLLDNYTDTNNEKLNKLNQLIIFSRNNLHKTLSNSKYDSNNILEFIILTFYYYIVELNNIMRTEFIIENKRALNKFLEIPNTNSQMFYHILISLYIIYLVKNFKLDPSKVGLLSYSQKIDKLVDYFLYDSVDYYFYHIDYTYHQFILENKFKGIVIKTQSILGYEEIVNRFKKMDKNMGWGINNKWKCCENKKVYPINHGLVVCKYINSDIINEKDYMIIKTIDMERYDLINNEKFNEVYIPCINGVPIPNELINKLVSDIYYYLSE